MANENIRKEIIGLLNKALELEHAARVQYLSHAELVDGLNADQIIARLKEIAEDEKKHQEQFRTLIGDYLDGTPSMEMSQTKEAKTIQEILKINLKGEKDAIDYYQTVLGNISKHKENLPYSFLQLEHTVRHVIMDEQEHIAELRKLVAMSMGEVEEYKAG